MTDRLYWNMEVEPLLNTEEMRARQLVSLKKRVGELWENAPYWRRRMEERGAHPKDLETLEDWPAMIAPFTKQDQLDLAAHHDFDYQKVWGEMLPVPTNQIRLIGATSGTTGEPVPSPFAVSDTQGSRGESHARMMWRAGVRPGDRWLHGFALSMFNAGVPMILGLIGFGACVIPVGAEAGTERMLRFAALLRPRILACTPSLAAHLIERCEEVLDRPATSLGIEIVVCGGEPGAGVPEIRERIETGFGARLFDMGGGPGISCDHLIYQGMHWVADDSMLYELFDPETGDPIALRDGAEGEMCVTNIVPGSGGRGFVRFTFGDIHRVETSPCPCGRSGIRYRIVGRSDDMLKVKGVIVYPAALSGVVSSFTPKLTGHFRIVLNAPPPRVEPPLQLRVEYGPDVSEHELEDLRQEVTSVMHDRLRVRPAVEWVPPGTLERASHKTQLFERRYQA